MQGLRPVPGASGLRALVANTIRYRRRKGTPGVIEQVARDVTGWPARVVEYYRLLGLTQHLDHVRLGAARTADLRDADGLALTGTPFDETARTGEVRHIDIGRGRYNVPDVGVHLWRLGAYPVAMGDARQTGPGWTFDPAGRDLLLFHRARTEPDNVTHLAEEVDVPAPLRRRALIRELTPPQHLVFLAEPDPALRIWLDGQQVPTTSLTCHDLSSWTPPGDASVAVDPVLGRDHAVIVADPAAGAGRLFVRLPGRRRRRPCTTAGPPWRAPLTSPTLPRPSTGRCRWPATGRWCRAVPSPRWETRWGCGTRAPM